MANPVTKHPVVVEKANDRQIANARSMQVAKAGRLMTRLERNAQGKLKTPMTSQQIKAAEVFLDRIWPKLSAITIIEDTNELEGMSRDELAQRAAGLIRSNPQLAQLTDIITAVNLQGLVGEASFVSEKESDAEVINFPDKKDEGVVTTPPKEDEQE